MKREAEPEGCLAVWPLTCFTPPPSDFRCMQNGFCVYQWTYYIFPPAMIPIDVCSPNGIKEAEFSSPYYWTLLTAGKDVLCDCKSVSSTLWGGSNGMEKISHYWKHRCVRWYVSVQNKSLCDLSGAGRTNKMTNYSWPHCACSHATQLNEDLDFLFFGKFGVQNLGIAQIECPVCGWGLKPANMRQSSFSDINCILWSNTNTCNCMYYCTKMHQSIREVKALAVMFLNLTSYNFK